MKQNVNSGGSINPPIKRSELWVYSSMYLYCKFECPYIGELHGVWCHWQGPCDRLCSLLRSWVVAWSYNCILYLHFLRGPDHNGSKGFEAKRWKLIHSTGHDNYNIMFHRELDDEPRATFCSGTETSAPRRFGTYISAGEPCKYQTRSVVFVGKFGTRAVYIYHHTAEYWIVCSWQSYWGNWVYSSGENFWFMWRSSWFTCHVVRCTERVN